MKIHIQEEINKLYVKIINIIARKSDSKDSKRVALAKLSHQWVIAYSYLEDLKGNEKANYMKKMYDLREKITKAISENIQNKR